MKKAACCLLAICCAAAAGGDFRPAVWAGLFYDEDPARLSMQIDLFLSQRPTDSPSGSLKAIIAPHAGYGFSGPIAGRAYVAARGEDVSSVVIIGPSHRHGFEGCSIYPRGGFATPLGVAPIDEALAAELSRASGFGFVPQAHAEEHSIEVQVPFIQKVFPGASIVPIAMGYPSSRTVRRLAAALTEILPKHSALVVVSTDMSHFLSRTKAREADARTTELIRTMNASELLRKLDRGENVLCGGGAVAAALLYMESLENPRVDILGYDDSTSGGGDPNSVVGYLSAALYAEDGGAPAGLSDDDKARLLVVARAAVLRFIRHGDILVPADLTPALKENSGVFVTLKKNGRLRGCIGFIEPEMPLAFAASRAAVLAASEDARFDPVTEDEIPGLSVEISVLTPLRPVSDVGRIEVGRHGLVIRQGDKTGILLPHVAVDNRWSRSAFLRQACLKAGLPANAWRRGAEILVFKTETFGERDPVL
ncbi:MAG: AmmeMemoRadiSam system protein B [Acidobacteriota bacterium]|nr:AmmeMemoRadiSam system protein B [Acidobacteriota bacterium]